MGEVTKPAVICGVYVDCKFMPGLKSARISIDLPIEHSNEFLRMFGAPDRASPVAVAIARMDVAALNAPSVPEKAVEPARVEKAERKRSSLAFLMCQDPVFQKWVHGSIIAPRIEGEPVACFDLAPYEWTNQTIKAHLGIKEKKDLDTDPEAAARFDSLRVDFEMRDHIR